MLTAAAHRDVTRKELPDHNPHGPPDRMADQSAAPTAPETNRYFAHLL